MDTYLRELIDSNKQKDNILTTDRIYYNGDNWNEYENDIKKLVQYSHMEDLKYVKKSGNKPSNYSTDNLVYNKFNGAVVFMAEYNGEVIGLIFLRKNIDDNAPDGLYMHDFIVDPRYRSQGVGTVLMNRAVMFTKQNGYKFIDLDVWEDNKNAVKMYEKHRFKKIEYKMRKYV